MAKTTAVQAGQDVDSFCGKCQLELAHIVVAKTPGRAARVKCKTCGAEHAMRAAAKKGSKTTGDVRAKPRSSAGRAQQAFAEALAGRDPSRAKAWSLTTRFAKGDILQHATFGLGVVEALSVPNKMTVVFDTAGTKVLLHAREPSLPLA